MSMQNPSDKTPKLQDGDPETTGHSWDGIQEFNNPLPRWWLWTFYACCVWGLIYTILYPAWPLVSSATSGLLGYSTRGEVAEDIAAAEAAAAPIQAALVEVALVDVTPEAHPDLYSYAINGGASVFATWCSQCHGSGAAGAQASGYPNLLDDDWLWGGTVDDIAYTIRHGIRYEGDWDTRFSQMPAYGEIFSDEEIDAVVQYVLGLSGQAIDGADADAAMLGATLFAENCSACHGEAGLGMVDLGAPNLTDAIWLYGGSYDDVYESVRYARYGVMPGWSERLSEAEIRAVAIWVHAQGGGQ